MSDLERNSIVIGVTGGIACGKSEVGRILCEMGFRVCDADHVAHDLMKKGSDVYLQVVEQFGDRILTDDDEISRAMLGKLVFDQPDKRVLLNGLVHPAVRVAVEEWIREMRSTEQLAAGLVPLLFESGMDTLDWNKIICVSSSDAEVFHRLEGRGLSHAEAKKRMNSQMRLAEKEKRADYVVSNRGTLGELERTTRKIVQTIVG